MFIDLTQPPEDIERNSDLLFAGMWHKRRRFMAQRRRLESAMRRRARKAERREARSSGVG